MWGVLFLVVYIKVKIITQGRYGLPDVVLLAALGIVVVKYLGFYAEGTICNISVILVRIIISRLQELLLTQLAWIPVTYEIVISGHDVEGEMESCIS
jgi:hypothetical protein